MKRDLLRLFLIGVMSIFTLGMSAQTMPDYLCFTTNSKGSTVELKKSGKPTEVTIEYSTDGSNWTSVDFSSVTTTDAITLNAGDKVYFRNASETVTEFSKDTRNCYKFVMKGTIAASGNVMSLVDQSCKTTTIPCTSCFTYLFNGCLLTSAPELPATTLTKDCYSNMFSGCTNLKTAPALPATTLAANCYSRMFTSCSSLISAPELPATTLTNYCYSNMFNGCTNLETAPELPATTMATDCYNQMFSICEKLSNISVAYTGLGISTTKWVYGVASSGTFSWPASGTETFGENNIPVSDTEKWTVKNTYDLTITDAGWASMCVNLPLQVPTGVEDLEVYYASAVSGTQITLTKIDGGTTIAAKTAVLVKGAKGTVSFPIMGEAGTSYTDNFFVGTSVDKPFNAEKNGAVYVLSKVNSGKPQFQNYVGTTLGAHKIWLPASAVGGSNAKALNFVFDNEATGINSVNENENEDENIYNLNGVRVNEGYKGIVIKNGKKVYNK